MNTKRLLFLGLTLLLVCSQLPQDVAAVDSLSGLGFVSTTTTECLRRIDVRDYAGAQRLAMKLAASPQWEKGEIEAAGAIRAIVDAFRAANRVDLAEKVLLRANQTHKATGYLVDALQGRSLPESVQRGLSVIDRTRDVLTKKGGPALFNPKTDLKRLRVGNQASVLKVMDSANKKVVYMRGLDGVMWAPVLEEHRRSIFTAIGILPTSLDQVVRDLMKAYTSTSQKKECIALLSIAGSSREPPLSDETQKELQSFLVKIMRGSTNVVLRRQACLCLALQRSLLPASVEAVVQFYEKSKNLWETFPVQQVFEYQKECINLMPNKSQIRARIAAVKELYTPNILKFLG